MASDLRAPFFDAAFVVLGMEGYPGLKQAKVCAALGVTTGAFYHSFDSWHDFTRQLLEHWLRERTERLVAAVSAEPDPLLRLQRLVEVAAGLPHRAEAGIRAWSLMEPEVGEVQAKVDGQRLRAIRTAFTELAGPEQAEEFAQTGLTLLVGFEQRQDVDAAHLRWALLNLLRSAGSTTR